MSSDRARPQVARAVRVRGIVQGVGFRPFVARLGARLRVRGWVLNDAHGVYVHAEASDSTLDAFVTALRAEAPPASAIESIDVTGAPYASCEGFVIRHSDDAGDRTVPISPDLPVCDDCLRELFDPADRRYGYPYITCTNCGPRYSIVTGLPYDRPNTTMWRWKLCKECASEYDDPLDRRYHAQPIACPVCGPHLQLEGAAAVPAHGDAAVVAEAARLLRDGAVVAVKGIGGYHLACDARNAATVRSLRERKFRKEKPFAVMARDMGVVRSVVEIDARYEALLRSPARPIVLVPARETWPHVAPEQSRLGVMLPYSPLHALLFAAGAPDVLVLTSGNRSSEPIAYRDEDARESLLPLADALLSGERPIARRVDDSVATAGPLGPVILRRSRGYAPAAVARLPAAEPILAVGGDLKNAVTLVVDGRAIVSPHIGDLDHLDAAASFEEAISDLLAMYGLAFDDVTIAHDLHPQYRSTLYARGIGKRGMGVQHHRAHIASVLAECNVDPAERVVGVALDGTGYGLDGTIWGGEFFAGSLADGLERVGHFAQARLPGGDAAARFPTHCALGYTLGAGVPPLDKPPFDFPERAMLAAQLLERDIAGHRTTSAGRLFDAAAALCGFTGEVTFEGQAAMWLEHRAEASTIAEAFVVPFDGVVLHTDVLIGTVARARAGGMAVPDVARAFHAGLALGIAEAAVRFANDYGVDVVALSGGVWQNALLCALAVPELQRRGLRVLTNRAVPPNDGGLSLGQAALATYALN